MSKPLDEKRFLELIQALGFDNSQLLAPKAGLYFREDAGMYFVQHFRLANPPKFYKGGHLVAYTLG